MKLTKRGKRVRAVAIILGILFILWVVSNLWWVGNGYCWGSIIECNFPELGGK